MSPKPIAVLMGLVLAAGLAGSALAQVDLRALRERDQSLQQQDIARQDLLADQRQRTAAQARYEAQLALRPLSSAPTEPSALGELKLRPTVPATPPRGPDASDQAAEAARLDQLMDQRLSESNARLRAITPAH
ncbi:MAG: hypothetical protein J7521_21405 [Caulobacter sp.]|nr:hypothetical protein [Caulobacter sp.]